MHGIPCYTRLARHLRFSRGSHAPKRRALWRCFAESDRRASQHSTAQPFLMNAVRSGRLRFGVSANNAPSESFLLGKALNLLLNEEHQGHRGKVAMSRNPS